MIAANVTRRRLELDGPVNFRDLGGYAIADGRHLRWGRVYRSDSLETLTPADIGRLDELGIRLVCDLRRDEERAAAPSRVAGHGDLRIEHLPIANTACRRNPHQLVVRHRAPEEVADARCQLERRHVMHVAGIARISIALDAEEKVRRHQHRLNRQLEPLLGGPSS